eukprot:320976-Pyramimonas_sp.AAC.1
MSHSRHVEPLRQVQLLDIVSMRAAYAFKRLCRFQTNDVGVAADVRKNPQHSIHHGPTVRGQGQFTALSEYSWHFRQCRTMHTLVSPLLQHPVVPRQRRENVH